MVRRRGEENIEEKTKADRRKTFKNKDNVKRRIQENSNNSKKTSLVLPFYKKIIFGSKT